MANLSPAPDQWTIFEAAHLLNRAGFGGSPGEIKALHAKGRHRAVEGLLAADEPPDAFPLPAWATQEQALADMRQRLEQLAEVRRAARTMSPEQAEKARREAFQAAQRKSRQQGIEGQGWWFRRMLLSKAPLREKMTLFWHDHFATSLQKVRQPVLMLMQNELFRRHALGDFKALTHAVLRDPAMMLYLDTQASKRGKPNENFAREVMELFTLGEGHYSEEDIRQAARAFTGYVLNRLDGKVSHNRRQWDEGAKTVFGRTGAFDGDDVIELIFQQAQAARFLPSKLWAFFVSESVPPPVVDALAGTFRESGFQITPVLREIFRSREFYSQPVIRDQIKSPLQFLVQMLKQLELEEAPQGYALAAQQQLGQVLFMPPNVAGWDWGKAWINTNTLLTRYNIAGFITKGSAEERRTVASRADGDAGMMMGEVRAGDAKGERRPGQAVRKGVKPERAAGAMNMAARLWEGPDYGRIAPREIRSDHGKLVDSLGFRFFQAPLPPQHRKRFLAYAQEKQGAVFTDHEVAELVHLMLSTPDYQLA